MPCSRAWRLACALGTACALACTTTAVHATETELPLPGEASAGLTEGARLAALQATAREFALGLAAEAQGDLEGAATAYARALRGDRAFVEAAVNLARVLVALERTSEARETLDRALAIDDAYPQTYAVRGLLAMRAGDARTARNELERALALDPDACEPRINLAALLMQQGLHAKARGHLAHVLDLDPEQPDAHLNLAIVEDATGNPAVAAHYYARFLALADGAPDIRRSVERRLTALRGAAPARRMH